MAQPSTAAAEQDRRPPCAVSVQVAAWLEQDPDSAAAPSLALHSDRLQCVVPGHEASLTVSAAGSGSVEQGGSAEFVSRMKGASVVVLLSTRASAKVAEGLSESMGSKSVVAEVCEKQVHHRLYRVTKQDQDSQNQSQQHIIHLQPGSSDHASGCNLGILWVSRIFMDSPQMERADCGEGEPWSFLSQCKSVVRDASALTILLAIRQVDASMTHDVVEAQRLMRFTNNTAAILTRTLRPRGSREQSSDEPAEHNRKLEERVNALEEARRQETAKIMARLDALEDQKTNSKQATASAELNERISAIERALSLANEDKENAPAAVTTNNNNNNTSTSHSNSNPGSGHRRKLGSKKMAALSEDNDGAGGDEALLHRPQSEECDGPDESKAKKSRRDGEANREAAESVLALLTK